MPQNLTLPWGKKETLNLALPDGWQPAVRLEPITLLGVPDPAAETRRGLSAPLGLPRLLQLARGKGRVALVIDDISRPTPVRQMLPVVLAELHAAGISPEQISLVPSLGMHRAMTAPEVGEHTGLLNLGGIKLITHDCDSASLVRLGTTQRGTPVLINWAVAEADLVISLGCIEPHLMASFSGGYKNIFPGVAGRAAIAHNQALNYSAATFSMVGQPIAANPMRLDLEEAGGMLKPPVFILNAVLNSAGAVVRVVCGHPIHAHRAGVELSAAVHGVKAAPADVVIANAHPLDQDLRQGCTALANTVRAVRRGGMLITLVRAEAGPGVWSLFNRKPPLGRAALRLLAPLLLPLMPHLKLSGLTAEDKFFLYFGLQAMRRATLLMVAPGIPAEIQERLPFVEFVPNPAAAVARAAQQVPGPARVQFFPSGGSTYPILE